MRLASWLPALVLSAALAAASPASAAPTPDPGPAPLALVVDETEMTISSRAGDAYGQIRQAPATGIWLSNLHPYDAPAKVTATVTIDASRLKGTIDDIEVPCDPDGDLVGVCEDIGPVHQGVPRPVGTLRLGMAKPTKPGTSAQVRITAETDDGFRVGQNIDVSVPEGGVKADRTLLPVKGVKPGSTLRAPGGFTNHSGGTLPRVAWSMDLTPGLSFPGTFRNCTSDKDPETQETRVSCVLRGPFAPFTSYDLDLGPLEVADRAMGESVSQSVEGSTDTPEPGQGPELSATPRIRGDSYVRTDIGEQQPLRSTVDTTNKADAAVTGAVLEGKPGDRVTAELSVRNDGRGDLRPNWRESTNKDAALTVLVPRGVTVVKAPTACFGYKTPRPTGTSRDHLGFGRSGGRSYTCGGAAGTPLPAGERLAYTFTFRIDKASEYSAGSVKTMYQDGDPRLKNNSAALVVDVAQPMGKALRAVIGSVLLLLCGGTFLVIRRRRRAAMAPDTAKANGT